MKILGVRASITVPPMLPEQLTAALAARLDRAWPGRPFPLGAHWDGEGTNFALWSTTATGVTVCLFDWDGLERNIPLADSTYHVWHGYLPGIGPGQHYGFRLTGPYNPEAGLFLALAPATASNWSSSVYKATPSELPTRLEPGRQQPGPADRDAGRYGSRQMPTGRSASPNGSPRWTVTGPCPWGRRSAIGLSTYITWWIAELRLLLGRSGDPLVHGGRDGAVQQVDLARPRDGGARGPERPGQGDLPVGVPRRRLGHNNTRMGDIRTYLSNEVAHAKSEGLGLVAGLNVHDASGVNTAPMTASQIKASARCWRLIRMSALCRGGSTTPPTCRRPECRAAFDSVGQVARSRARRCA